MGSPRTCREFYIVLGLGITIFLTIEAIVFWLLGSLAHTNAARVPRPRFLRAGLFSPRDYYSSRVRLLTRNRRRRSCPAFS